MAIYSPNGDIDANGAEEVNLRTSTGVELLGQKASAASLPVVIASDQTAINVNVVTSPSSPPSASTISQYVAANKVYSFSADLNMALADSQNPLILLNNPIGSGKVIYLYKVIFGINVTNVLAEFKLYANPTITTNGTAITPVSTNIGNGAPASILQAFSLSTVSSPGTNLESITISQNNSAFGILEDFSIFIQPGNKFLLTGNPSSNNRVAAVTVVWVEV